MVGRGVRTAPTHPPTIPLPVTDPARRREDTPPNLLTGLTVTGEHQFRVSGRNSRGDGPVSAVVTVEVPVAAAA